MLTQVDNARRLKDFLVAQRPENMRNFIIDMNIASGVNYTKKEMLQPRIVDLCCCAKILI